MSEMQRIYSDQMEYYRHVYHFSERWNGLDPLSGKTVVCYCEQGYGDIIQMLRYMLDLKKTGCKVILHCPEELHPLLPYCEGVDEWIDKKDPKIPKHDYHILSLSLPFLLGVETSSKPYLKYKEKADLSEFDKKIGIAWEGSPAHPKNEQRCCPLKHFKSLIDGKTSLFMLQNEVNLPQEEVDVYSIPIKNFGDTASLINAVDYVVTVDTSILHLAGAMGKRTYGLLGQDYDPRWQIMNWYESVTLIKSDTWEDSFNILKFYDSNSY